MDQSTDHYEQLLKAYINSACSPEQVEEVLHFLQQNESNRLLLQQLQAEFGKAMEMPEQPLPAFSDNLRNRLLQAIQPAPVIPFYKRWLFRVAAAAIVVMVMVGSWFFFFNIPPAKKIIHQQRDQLPAGTVPKGPTLTLADGRQIPLDQTAGGTIIQQGNTQVLKRTDGQIAYDTATANNVEVSYHTLTVPPGCKMVQLMLADGTAVWLNNTSSLKYPTAFTGRERRVELTGEAYFEVKHDGNKPFEVHTKNITVHVLGTSFNVSDYSDDDKTNVVLEGGSVALSVPAGSRTITKQLKPGQLASFESGTGRLSVATVNTNEYTSWRKGYLLFKQASLQQIVKQLSRYYGVRIAIDAQVLDQETFSGRLDLQKDLNEVMQLVCIGTATMYSPAEKKITLKK